MERHAKGVSASRVKVGRERRAHIKKFEMVLKSQVFIARDDARDDAASAEAHADA
jgi:hypothetical protein